MVVFYAVARNLVEAQCDLKVTSSTFLIQMLSDLLKQQNEYSLIVHQTCQHTIFISQMSWGGTDRSQISY